MKEPDWIGATALTSESRSATSIPIHEGTLGQLYSARTALSTAPEWTTEKVSDEKDEQPINGERRVARPTYLRFAFVL